ncbi:MAG TPA: 6-pyruvoyl-tetrahydropterin synthase-related protein [Candidatus Limnocylindria bacterium]|nr:6-pyruvoyl-tetrahydropterin synthase-related protein [Candidatus Limnocylindria bacterium]
MNIRWIAEHRRHVVLGALVAVPTLFTAIGLLPELTIPVPSNNDDATHFLLIQRLSEALGRGENPLDFWVPQVELGFPWLVYYQPLPALAVVFLHRALLGAVDLITVFNVVRYLLLIGLPLTVFWSLRHMGVSAAGAAVAAAASPLLSGAFRYGFDYDSYIWRGFGLFTQLAAMHLSFVVLAVVWNTLRSKERDALVWGSLALTALVVTHLIYSYMMAITLAVLVVAGAESRRDVLRRLLRYVIIGIPAAAATAWLWLPLISQTAFAGVSPYLQREKFDSYGAPAILGWLFSGDLLDHGRLPVITAMVFLGIVVAAITRTPLARSTLALFVVWLVLYFGRPTLDGLVSLLPMQDSLLIHRFIGSVELFAIVLIGIGAGWCFERIRASESPVRFVLAAAAALVLLIPAMNERAAFYGLNTTWMRQTIDAINADVDARTILSAIRDRPSGRVFAGLRSTGYGPLMNFGIPFNSVRFSDLLVFNAIPLVAAPYGSASLNADLIWDFAVDRPDHYQLFNVAYVVAPAATPMPEFLSPITRTARYILYVAPTTGYVTYGAIVDRQSVTKQTALFAINRPWFNGADNAALRFHRFDYPSSTNRASGEASAGCTRPTYAYERMQPSRLDLLVGCPARSTLVLKITYHPNWHVTVDGREAAAFMVSPSFIGVALEPGDHFVTAEYRSTPSKTPLFIGGVLIVLAELAYVWRERLRRLLAQARDWARTSGLGRVVRKRLPQLQ